MGVLKWPIPLSQWEDSRLREAVGEADAWDNEEYAAGGFLGALASWTAENWSALPEAARIGLRDWIETQLINEDSEIADDFAAQFLSPLARLTEHDTVSGPRQGLGLLGRLYVATADDGAGGEISWYAAPDSALPPLAVKTEELDTLLARTDPEWNVVLLLDVSACPDVEDARAELSMHLPMGAPARRSREVLGASIALGFFRLRAPVVTVWVRPPECENARREVLQILDIARRAAAPVSAVFSDRFEVHIVCAPCGGRAVTDATAEAPEKPPTPPAPREDPSGGRVPGATRTATQEEQQSGKSASPMDRAFDRLRSAFGMFRGRDDT